MISIFARQQQRASLSGRALNQCPQCQVFRVDGRIPTVHRTGCGLGPDGAQVGALRTGGTRWHEWSKDAPAAPAQWQKPSTSLATQRRRSHA